VPVLCECIRILCSTVWVFPWFCVFWVVVCGCLFLLGCVECGGGSALCLCVCVLCSPVSMSWALFLCWV